MYKIYEVIRVYMVDFDNGNDFTNEVEKLTVEDDDILNIAKWLVDYGISGFRGNIGSIVNLRNTLDTCGETHSLIDECLMKLENGSYVKTTNEYKIVKES